MILNLDCRHGLAMLPDNSVDAIVTDAPYELSNDGKQSAARVFSKFVFPKNAKVETEGTCGDALALLITEVFCLGSVGAVPSPATAVPISPMAFNNQSSFGQNNVEYSAEGSVDVSQNCASGDIKAETFKHLGSFTLELADPAKFVEILNQLGTGFTAGGVGIGLSDFSSRVPSLEHCRPPVVSADEDVAFRAYALSHLVSALIGATGFPVLGFNLAGGTNETFTANGARLFFAIALASGAKFIRANTGTGRLPTVLEARRICVVDDAANRAFSFDLVVHPQSIRGIGFMGKEWDGSKIAYDVGVWREALRVLKPGGHMLAFSGSRTYHRMAVAIEDAGFEIRDQIMWIYGSGYPKHRSSLKPAHEPIVLARKPAERATLLNIDACRVEGRERTEYGLSNATRTAGNTYGTPSPGADFDSTVGRYPANLIHDGSDEVVAMFPDSAGSGGSVPNVKISGYGDGAVGTGSAEYLGGERTKVDCGTGSAARFFYCAKSSKKDRNEGLEAFDAVMANFAAGTGLSKNGDGSPRNMAADAKNPHPTVKPTELMRYLCRLVTPPGGLIVDPFAGSGSTGKAAILEGFQFVGFELDPQYTAIANARLEAARNAA